MVQVSHVDSNFPCNRIIITVKSVNCDADQGRPEMTINEYSPYFMLVNQKINNFTNATRIHNVYPNFNVHESDLLIVFSMYREFAVENDANKCQYLGWIRIEMSNGIVTAYEINTSTIEDESCYVSAEIAANPNVIARMERILIYQHLQELAPKDPSHTQHVTVCRIQRADTIRRIRLPSNIPGGIYIRLLCTSLDTDEKREFFAGTNETDDMIGIIESLIIHRIEVVNKLFNLDDPHQNPFVKFPTGLFTFSIAVFGTNERYLNGIQEFIFNFRSGTTMNNMIRLAEMGDDIDRCKEFMHSPKLMEITLNNFRKRYQHQLTTDNGSLMKL